MRKNIALLFLIITIGCGEKREGELTESELFSHRESLFLDKNYSIAELALFIDPAGMDRLSLKRRMALYRGVLNASPQDWIAALVIYNGDSIPVELRLKGDLGDHWGHEKHWSFKIKVSGNKTIMGLKRFAIQHPLTRSYLNEWYFHKLLSDNGLISLKYEFVKVSLNGEQFPIYALEQNFDKTLVEGNEYREGLVFKFDGDFLWHTYPGSATPFYSTDISPYQKDRTARSKELTEQLSTVNSLIELYRHNKLATHQLFNAEKLAWLFAIIDLTGHHHASQLENMRFYFNPLPSLIEPIGYDNQEFLDLSKQGMLGEHKLLESNYELDKHDLTNSNWYKAVFRDEVFYKHYTEALNKLSNPEYMTSFFDATEEEAQRNIELLKISYPAYSFTGKEVLYSNQKYIAKMLSPVNMIEIAAKGHGSDRSLFITNNHSMPIELITMSVGDSSEILPILQSQSSIEVMTFSGDAAIGDLVAINYRVLGAATQRAEITVKQFVDSKRSEQNVTNTHDQSTSFVRRTAAKVNYDCSKTFDYKKMAMMFVALDIMGMHTESALARVDLIYNSTSKLIEPRVIKFSEVVELRYSIPSGEIWGTYGDYSPHKNNVKLNTDKWWEVLFSDRSFFGEYVSVIERIANHQIFEDKNNKADLYGLKAYYASSDKEGKLFLKRNCEYLRNYISPVKSISAHIKEYDHKQQALYISFDNIHKLPIEIVSLSMYRDWIFVPQSDKLLEGANNSSPYLSKVLGFKVPERFLISIRKQGEFKMEFPWDKTLLNDLKVEFRVLGRSETKRISVNIRPKSDPAFLLHDLRRRGGNMNDFNFLIVDEGGKTVKISNGKWAVDRHMIITKGYEVSIDGDTQLDLINGAAIISYSSITARGTSDAPISFISSDSTGQGLIVLETNNSSVFDHVVFANQGSLAQKGWRMTGAINLYESDVNFYNCVFEHNRSEDALNIFRSSFGIDNTEFSHTASDALDLDFSTGKLQNLTFQYIGNDAIDICGGDSVVLLNIEIRKYGDKGISIGEKAVVSAGEISISDTEVAWAIKDLSDVYVNSSTVTNCKLVTVVFQKKAMYAGAAAQFDGLTVQGPSELYLLEEQSSLKINNEEKSPNSAKVYSQNTE